MALYYLISLITILFFTQVNFFYWPILVIIQKKSFALAFFTGLITDLFIGKTLGSTSVILLISVALFYFLKSHFHNNLRVTLVVIIICQILIYVGSRFT